jgi:hypothetical protein
MFPRLSDFVLEVCELFVEAAFSGSCVVEIIFNGTKLVIDRLDYSDVSVCKRGVVRTLSVFWTELDLDIAIEQ